MLGSVDAASAPNLLEISETAASEIGYALDRDDLSAARNLAHKPASSAPTYGLERMAQLLKAVEQSDDAEPRLHSQELINSLNSEHEKPLAAIAVPQIHAP